jgi:hypothetical protein
MIFVIALVRKVVLFCDYIIRTGADNEGGDGVVFLLPLQGGGDDSLQRAQSYHQQQAPGHHILSHTSLHM